MQGLNNLYDYKVSDVENILEVRSDTLYPLSSSTTQKKYIFRLEPTGYLDANSVLCFKLKSVSGGGDKRVNTFNGALGGIKRAVFSVGDFVLNDTDALSKWSTLENLMSKSRTAQNNYYAHYFGNSFHTSICEDVVPEGGQVVNPYGGLCMDAWKAGMSYGGYLDGGSDVGAVGGVVKRVWSGEIQADENSNTQYGVPLGFLFPCLKGRIIPLFLFEQYKIYITVYFNEPSEYINNTVNDDYTSQKMAAGNSSVAVVDVKLQLDYLLYPSSVINKQLEMISKEGGYVMDFYDVSHIMKQIPAAEDRVKQMADLKIGQEGKEVHKLYLLKHFSNNAGRRNAALLGAQCDSVNLEAVNWNINGIDVYTQDLTNPASQYQQLTWALDTKLDVERSMYIMDENSEWGGLTGKWSPLNGTYKPLALDLRNGSGLIVGGGSVIGQYPITCKYSRTGHQAFDQPQDETHQAVHYNSWIGALDVDIYAMTSRRAVIKNSIKGGQIVSVSY